MELKKELLTAVTGLVLATSISAQAAPATHQTTLTTEKTACSTSDADLLEQLEIRISIHSVLPAHLRTESL
jgi:hypothetical protein